MKAIFLDFEGPIVSHRTIIANTDLSKGIHYSGRIEDWIKWVDATAVGLIVRLCKTFDAKIVVTSTLRYEGLIINQFETMVNLLSGTDDLLHGITESRRSHRELEIEDYVEKHAIEKWVAIDDKRLTLKNFVWVDPREGFSYENYQQSKPFLTDEESKTSPELIFL